MLLEQQNPNEFHQQQSPYFFSEIQMSDITDISEENMKILTGLPAKSARVKKYLCITDASYIYGNLHFFSLITHTHTPRVIHKFMKMPSLPLHCTFPGTQT